MRMKPEIPVPEPQFLLDGFRAEAGAILDADGHHGRVVNLMLVLRATGYPEETGFTLQTGSQGARWPGDERSLWRSCTPGPGAGTVVHQ
jgi:hypothetical protein